MPEVEQIPEASQQMVQALAAPQGPPKAGIMDMLRALAGGPIGQFATGGVHGVLKGAGVPMPQWMDTAAGILQNPELNAALAAGSNLSALGRVPFTPKLVPKLANEPPGLAVPTVVKEVPVAPNTNIKLTPTEIKYFTEAMKPKHGLLEDVPSVRLEGNYLKFDAKDFNKLWDFMDASRVLRNKGEKLPPSFYDIKQLLKRSNLTEK